jgi:hypothetical protein
MFKGNNKYIWIFVGMFIAVVTIQYLLPKPLNWQHTYLNKDKGPLGAYAIYNLLQPAYGKDVDVNKNTIYNLTYNQGDEPKCLVVMDQSITLNKTDLKTMFRFLRDGNTVFIAGGNFGGPLADTFHLRTTPKMYTWFEKPDSLIKRPGVRLRLTASNQKNKVYKYPMLANSDFFTNYDTTKFSVCSTMDDSSVVMIQTKIGEGKLILMTMPDVFTNYFIANHPNRDYAYSVLSYATQNTSGLIWDEYYKAFNVQSASFLKLIMESDALYAAYLLMLLTIIIYMISDGRRRQRPIPVLEPVKNTTLEFVNVVSHVYFNSANHKYIADERVKYFYETIRKRFNVATNDINEEFLQTIQELSGYDPKLIRQLFIYCERLQKLETASEHDLIELNRQITNFNTKSLR